MIFIVILCPALIPIQIKNSVLPIIYGSLSLGNGLKDMKKVPLAVLALILFGGCSINDDQTTIFEGEVQLSGEDQSYEGLEVGIFEASCESYNCDFNWKRFPLNDDGIFSIRLTTKTALSFGISVWTVEGIQLPTDCDPKCFDLDPDKKHSNLILYAKRP